MACCFLHIELSRRSGRHSAGRQPITLLKPVRRRSAASSVLVWRTTSARSPSQRCRCVRGNVVWFCRLFASAAVVVAVRFRASRAHLFSVNRSRPTKYSDGDSKTIAMHGLQRLLVPSGRAVIPPTPSHTSLPPARVCAAVTTRLPWWLLSFSAGGAVVPRHLPPPVWRPQGRALPHTLRH